MHYVEKQHKTMLYLHDNYDSLHLSQLKGDRQYSDGGDRPFILKVPWRPSINAY